ncbi:MAG: PEP-CTERM sorting domain-containing protein [Steroidobacteraceae bacterium]
MRHLSSTLCASALLVCFAGSVHAGTLFTNIIDPANPTFTQALGINNAGTVVGYGNATAFDGFELTPPYGSGNFTRENYPNASPPPSTLFTQVTGIDSVGDTVGFYVTNPSVGTTSGFGRASAGPYFTINQPGFVFNQALGVNQDGALIAGYSSTDVAGMTGQQAFTYNGSSFTDINALLPANLNSQATGVNTASSVVGFYQYDKAGDFAAFVDQGGLPTSFQFPGSTSTQALGINDLGDIVGDYLASDGVMFGFEDIGGVFDTINPPGATSATANGINDLGQVVGFYTVANGDTIGFVTSTVPEPGPLGLLGAGLIYLAMRRGRGRARHSAGGLPG